MRAFAHDRHTYPLPAGHRFPLAKYRLVRETVELMPGVVVEDAPPASRQSLLLGHDPDYLERVERGQLTRREELALGFPWSGPLVERARHSVGATLSAAAAALEDGAAANLGGGTHHAFPDSGRGFCVFNDVVVAVRSLREAGRIGPVLVVDLDVHQGDGTHFSFFDDADTVTASVNGFGNYPFQRVPADVEVDLPDGTGDDSYLSTVDRVLSTALARGRPDLCFYLAGADAYEGDRLGRLAVSKEGLATRERLVRDRLRAAGIPVCVMLAGGYADPIEDTVEICAASVGAFSVA